MKQISDVRINKREIRVELEWHEIKAILALKTATEIGFNGKYEWEIELKEIKEGSPEYSTGKYRAYVTLTEEYEIVK